MDSIDDAFPPSDSANEADNVGNTTDSAGDATNDSGNKAATADHPNIVGDVTDSRDHPKDVGDVTDSRDHAKDVGDVTDSSDHIKGVRDITDSESSSQQFEDAFKSRSSRRDGSQGALNPRTSADDPQEGDDPQGTLNPRTSADDPQEGDDPQGTLNPRTSAGDPQEGYDPQGTLNPRTSGDDYPLESAEALLGIFHVWTSHCDPPKRDDPHCNSKPRPPSGDGVDTPAAAGDPLLDRPDSQETGSGSELLSLGQRGNHGNSAQPREEDEDARPESAAGLRERGGNGVGTSHPAEKERTKASPQPVQPRGGERPAPAVGRVEDEGGAAKGGSTLCDLL